MRVQIANVLALLTVALGASACIVIPSPSGGTSGAGSGTGSGSGSGAGAAYSWDDGPPGAYSGPFADFKTFRSGCGEQLWGRFIPQRDFTLNELYARQGGAPEIPVVLEETRFFAGAKTVLLVSEQGNFRDNVYTFRYATTDANGANQKDSFKLLMEPLFRWENGYTIASSTGGVKDPLVLNLNPTFTGKAEQV